jgi:serine protease AprX
MRYSAASKTMTLSQIEAEVLKAGGKNVRKTELTGQLFCELDEEQAKRLSLAGLQVKPVRGFKVDQLVATTPALETPSQVFYLLRSSFAPPLTGTGLTVAVLDTGIRKTHRDLLGKVVYEKNCTGSPSTDDVFGHGTNIAGLIAGGIHGEEAGVSPGAKVLNIKVMNDEGIGTEEEVVIGIDEVCRLAKEARETALFPTDEMYPNLMNLSFGTEDDGDPDNPVRVACRKAVVEYGVDIVGAAGNSGPKMTTITLPACEPLVIAVGAAETLGYEVWEKSSRGPTLEAETKPDFVLWGTNIRVASNEADNTYDAKSGTSFSAPMLSGLAGLLWESGRRAYGESWLFRWTTAREVAPHFCVKPADAPAGKDNTYGYGLPVSFGITPPEVSVMQATASIMGLSMLGMMMAGIVRAGL